MTIYELFEEILGILESEYEGTDCHQDLIRLIKKWLEDNDKN